jgi:hypothetical protein
MLLDERFIPFFSCSQEITHTHRFRSHEESFWRCRILKNIDEEIKGQSRVKDFFGQGREERQGGHIERGYERGGVRSLSCGAHNLGSGLISSHAQILAQPMDLTDNVLTTSRYQGVLMISIRHFCVIY